MEQKSGNSDTIPNPPKDFLVFPVVMAEFIFKSRKFRAFELLFHLKCSTETGVLPTEQAYEIAGKAGIKSTKTIQNHLAYLEKHGFISFRKKGTVIRLWSLFRLFPSKQTGIRIYKSYPDSFKNQLFQGISAYFMRRCKFINRISGKPTQKGGRTQRPGIQNECTSGVSVNYLSTILGYSNVRISQIKKSGSNLKTSHRYRTSFVPPADLNQFRNHDPKEARKHLRTKTGIVQQLVDLFTFTAQPEFTRRRLKVA